jgi:hypothetical protein
MFSAPTANLVNAAMLLVMSFWGYFASDNPSLTALIPAGFGMALLLCQQGVMRENRVIAHVAVLLTLLVFVALFMPMNGAIARGDNMAMVRVGLMLATSLAALVAFVLSFIAARRARSAAG